MLEQKMQYENNGNNIDDRQIDTSGQINNRGQRLDPGPLEYLRLTSKFTQRDWVIYIFWIGIMYGLGFSLLGFLLAGLSRGATYPSYVWLIPVGILTFSIAITWDNIAHTVIYKEWISDAEYMVHNFSTATGVLTVFALLAGYELAELMRIPIYVFAGLSIIYSLIDEAMHWIRYARGGSGWVEVTAHFLILVGHTTMVLSWIWWFETGYNGFGQALSFWS